MFCIVLKLYISSVYQREIVFSIFKRPINGKSLLWEFLYCIQLFINVFLSSFCDFALCVCVCVRFSSSKLFHGKGGLGKVGRVDASGGCSYDAR